MTGKTDACGSLEGLAGKKIRTFGSQIPHMMSAVGATPVTVPAADLYEAVDRGTIDYSFVNLGNIDVLRLYEAGKYSCGPALNIAGHMVVVGDRTWNRLPEDIQAIITEEAAKTQQDTSPGSRPSPRNRPKRSPPRAARSSPCRPKCWPSGMKRPLTCCRCGSMR